MRVSEISGFDLRAFNAFRSNDSVFVDVEHLAATDMYGKQHHQLLSAPAKLFDFDFERPEQAASRMRACSCARFACSLSHAASRMQPLACSLSHVHLLHAPRGRPPPRSCAHTPLASLASTAQPPRSGRATANATSAATISSLHRPLQIAAVT